MAVTEPDNSAEVAGVVDIACRDANPDFLAACCFAQVFPAESVIPVMLLATLDVTLHTAPLQ